jgi:hypothetical protein
MKLLVDAANGCVTITSCDVHRICVSPTLLTKYDTKLLSAHYQVADMSPYCMMTRSLCTCISSRSADHSRLRLGLLCNPRTLNHL